MSDEVHSAEDIFAETLAITDPDERRSYLSKVCGQDEALRVRLERLLEAAEHSGRFFAHVDQADDDMALMDPGEKPGDRIGPYRLLERIGEGGFGTVYVAEQETPIRRRVALKIIKLGMDTRQVIARFEAERQALALMDHPNIARIFDAGVVSSKSEIRNQKSEIQGGRPYFVMELVRGVPITRFCDEQRLSPEQRLRVFLEVCDAVQHAHQKGIIHRDLKPSNILVTLHGSKAVPKIIDFGIAKATHEPLTDKTLYTRFHQFLGTPAYVSPEQAEMSGLEIDTRSDIYSLGVLLYELLTGKTPFDSDELLKAGLAQFQRCLREQDPPRPTTRLARMNQVELSTTADRRRCAPPELRAWLEGDLERVILKALEKDLDRRYASAAALGDDLEHFLNHEPVTAVAPSNLYVIRKFVRRHRLGVTAGALVAVSVIVGLGLALMGWISAGKANRRAQQEAAAAQATLGFLQEDLLGRLDPFRRRDADLEWGRNLTLLEAVKTASAQLGDRFADRPRVEASLRLTLGRAYLALGDVEAAGPQLEQALELSAGVADPDDPSSLDANHYYAEYLAATGRATDAVAIHQKTLHRRMATVGSDARPTLESMQALAQALFATGTSYPEAEALLRGVIARGTEAFNSTDVLVLQAKQGLSELLFQEGHVDESRQLEDQVFEDRRQVLGPDHPDFLYSAALRAYDLRYRLEDFHAAELLGNEVLEKSQRFLGSDSFVTRLMLVERGMRLQARGLWGQSIESRRELLDASRRRYGSENREALYAADMLGGSLRFFGDSEAAEQVHRVSVEMRTRHGKPSNRWDQRSEYYLAWAVFHQGRVEEAQSIFESVIEQAHGVDGSVNDRVLHHAKSLLALLGKQADWPGITRLMLDLATHDSGENDSHQPMGHLPYPAGVLAAQLAGESSAVRVLLDALFARHLDSTNPVVAGQAAMLGLSLQPGVLQAVERDEFHRMAGIAVNAYTGSLESTLIGGMMAYRMDDLDRAATQLASLESNPNRALASTTDFIQAMILFRHGATEEAQRLLADASNRLGIGLATGVLDHRGQLGFDYELRWADYARSILLRDEAENLILGGVVSPPVDRERLAARRQLWAPVQSHLNEAERHGRDRNWAEARESFLSALALAPLNWEEHGNFVVRMHEKAALVFALTGDFERYSELCRDLLEPALVSQSYYLRLGLFAPEYLPEEIRSKSLAMARWQAAQLGESRTRPIDQDWIRLDLGLAEYRAGDLKAAMTALGQAQDAFNLNCAGTAHAFMALALRKVGKMSEGRESLARAEALLQQMIEGNPDRLSQYWHETALLELAIAEARDSLEAATQ